MFDSLSSVQVELITWVWTVVVLWIWVIWWRWKILLKSEIFKGSLVTIVVPLEVLNLLNTYTHVLLNLGFLEKGFLMDVLLMCEASPLLHLSLIYSYLEESLSFSFLWHFRLSKKVTEKRSWFNIFLFYCVKTSPEFKLFKVYAHMPFVSLLHLSYLHKYSVSCTKQKYKNWYN